MLFVNDVVDMSLTVISGFKEEEQIFALQSPGTHLRAPKAMQVVGDLLQSQDLRPLPISQRTDDLVPR